MLPFYPGITGYYTEENNTLSLELRSLRNLRAENFITKDQTIINTIKQGYSPILEDYLGDNLHGFSDTFFKMMEYPIPNAGEEREFEIFDGVKMKFCWIPAGESQLGSPGEEQDYVIKTFLNGRRPEWLDGEAEAVRGIHKSNGSWLGKYEVTQSQWKKVMGNNPSVFKGNNLPVEQVSWNGCQDFIKKCSVSGLNVQLPHENQWEYACRGGKGNTQPFYWGDTLNGDKANCVGVVPYGTEKKGKYLYHTTEAGSYEKKAPHPWGLCDMSGNVYEWCENLYRKEGTNRVARGGSWGFHSGYCRSSYRASYDSLFRSSILGFRLIIC